MDGNWVISPTVRAYLAVSQFARLNYLKATPVCFRISVALTIVRAAPQRQKYTPFFPRPKGKSHRNGKEDAGVIQSSKSPDANAPHLG